MAMASRRPSSRFGNLAEVPWVKVQKVKNLGNLTNNLKMWYNTKVLGHIILIFWHSLFLPLRLFGGCRNANIFAILAVVWRKCHLVCGGSDYPLPPNYRQSLAVGVGHLSHWANFEQLAVRIKMLKCRRLPREFSSCLHFITEVKLRPSLPWAYRQGFP